MTTSLFFSSFILSCIRLKEDICISKSAQFYIFYNFLSSCQCRQCLRTPHPALTDDPLVFQKEVSTAQVRASLPEAADGSGPVQGLQSPQQSPPQPAAQHDAGPQRLPGGGKQDDELLRPQLCLLQICRVSDVSVFLSCQG